MRIISSLYVLSSTDPDWNNASYHPVSIIIDPTGEGDDYTVLAVITHQGGDQTFLRSDGMLKFIKQGENDHDTKRAIRSETIRF